MPLKRADIAGIAAVILGFGTTFLLMAREGRTPHGPLWGMLAMLVGVAGLLQLLGLLRLDDPSAPGIRDTVFGRLRRELPRDATAGAAPYRSGGPAGSWLEPAWAAPLVTVPLSLLVLFVGAPLGGAQAAPIVVLVALACLLPSAMRRPGLLVFVLVSALYLPLLGAYALWDPWETHYGEVAREILSRDDWISLWWAQENFFWSKPILIFWAEALSLGAFGAGVTADAVLPLPDGSLAHPEWALRLPVFLMSLAAVMAVYAAMRRIYGTRVGVLSALVLATTPHFFFLSHQAITDMPLVANMTVALCFLMLAMAEDPEKEPRVYRVGRLGVSLATVVTGVTALLSLPQILYLFSRNLAFVPWDGFAPHRDAYLWGSPGNETMGGNPELREMTPVIADLQPWLQALVWLAGLGAVLFLLRREKKTQGLFMYVFYLGCALAFMGKGIPGFALPGLVALLHLVVSRRWSLLLEGRLRVAPGALTLLVVGLPWYVAMFVRHGPGFTNRLVVHDHLNRLASGVHGDSGSIQYFIEQLGYALHPWVALLPAAALLWLWLPRPSADAESPAERTARESTVFIALWLFASFALFSAMATKFHHYIFPAVPAAAMLIGLLLDRMWGSDEASAAVVSGRRVASSAMALLAPVPLVLGTAGLYGDVRGVVPAEVRASEVGNWVLMNPPSTFAVAALLALGVALLAGAWWLGRSKTPPAPHPLDAALGAALLAGAVVLALVGRDTSWETASRPQGYERLIGLFVYNYRREWPEQLDYRPILSGFAIVATAIVVVAASRRLRPVASRALLGVALTFGVWALDVYIMDLSDHWSLRPLVARYYQERTGPEQELVAWQMNWKGENFYTGNHVNAFVQLDNARLNAWLREHRGEDAFFVFEHNRLGTFKNNVLRNHEVEELTTRRDCNKFVLVRVRDLQPAEAPVPPSGGAALPRRSPRGAALPGTTTPSTAPSSAPSSGGASSGGAPSSSPP